MVRFLIYIVFFSEIFIGMEFKNNACKDYRSYLNPKNNPNCFYIPDSKDDVLEIARRHTSSGEAHSVTTEDGYILGLFRIPRKNPKDVVLLQHDILLDSRHWLGQYNESAALVFWRAGYDVWLGNARGTLYSKKHLKLNPNQKAFWNFSFHEMGFYDLHAMTEYIKEKTGRSQIFYVGYGPGGSAGFVYTTLRPADSKSIKGMVVIGPKTFLKYMKSPVKYTLLPFAHLMVKYNLETIFNWYSFTRHHSWYLKLLRKFNEHFPFKKVIAMALNFIAGGFPDQADPRYLNVFVDQFGSAVSWKTLDHFYQITNDPNGTFRMYDLGKKENLKIYGEEKPPKYPLENVQIPVLIVHGEEDTVVPPKDIETLYRKLPEKTKMFGKRQVQGFGSWDFVVGKDRNEKAYKHMLDFFDNILSTMA